VKNCIILCILILKSISAIAQVGGQSVYSFLNLPNSARVLALGGSTIAIRDDDVNMAYQNPGLINPSMASRLSLSFVDYFAGINFGNAAYAFNVKKAGTAAVSLQYINYGSFTRADPTGYIDGEFTAGEYCINTAFSRQIDSMFTVGINLKTISSTLETYQSFGMAVDLGASWVSRDKLFQAGLVIKNLGYQFSSYTSGNRENLPFEIQLGVSKKLEHVPLRFSLVAHNLQQPDLTFKDPQRPELSIDPLTGDTIENKIGLGNKIMRHGILGAELNLMKNLVFRMAYNYQRRQEMKVDSRLKMVGFSWGLDIKIYKFSIAYSRSAYHLAGSPNMFTVSAKLSEFYRKQ
jgi:hypothetical protein